MEPWIVFNITPEEVQTVWLMLEKHKSLYDYVLGKALSPEKEAKIVKCEAEEAAKSEARDPV